MSSRLSEIVVRRLRLPLITPYRLSYRTFEEFESILVELRDDAGVYGFGEGHISPGSSSETREGGWAFVQHHAKATHGLKSAQAKSLVEEGIQSSSVAATALISALEVLEDCPLLHVNEPSRLPLLSPGFATSEKINE